MRGVESACLVRISSVIEDIDKFLGLWGDGVKCLELELNRKICTGRGPVNLVMFSVGIAPD